MDLSNLIALQAAAFRLDQALNGAPSAERSTLVQVLGEEVEQRAAALLAEVRVLRGDADHVAVPEPEPEPEPVEEGPRSRVFNAAAVRDAMVMFRSCTFGELVTHLTYNYDDVDEYGVRKHVKAWSSGSTPIITSRRQGRETFLEYIPPQPTTTQRPKQAPPEKATPGAGAERRANGEVVEQGALARSSKRARSTPGVRHRIQQAEMQKRRMEAARQKRRKK